MGDHRDQGGFRPLWLALIVAFVLGGAGYLFREDISALFRSEDTPRTAITPVPGPTATTSPVPSPTPTEEPRGRLLIHGTGDVNLDPSYIPELAANGYQHAWTGLHGLFRQDDLTAVNLECAVSDLGTAVRKEFNFRCDPAALPAMRRAGVEVANLGNNHAYDYGSEALLDSIANLRRNRIEPVGAGRNAAVALSPALFELNGWTVAVVGIDQVVDPFPEAVAAQGHPGTAAGHDTDAMIRAIRDARRQADLVIVTIHWGVELDTEPRPEQVELGHAFVEAGADVGVDLGGVHRRVPQEFLDHP